MLIFDNHLMTGVHEQNTAATLVVAYHQGIKFTIFGIIGKTNHSFDEDVSIFATRLTKMIYIAGCW